jgi:hypothetical protein
MFKVEGWEMIDDKKQKQIIKIVGWNLRGDLQIQNLLNIKMW